MVGCFPFAAKRSNRRDSRESKEIVRHVYSNDSNWETLKRGVLQGSKFHPNNKTKNNPAIEQLFSNLTA